MTTLAGAVPRMMRPGPGQNYPRSGFPLEGKRGPQPRGEPRTGPGLLRPTVISEGSFGAARDTLAWAPLPAEGSQGEIHSRFSPCKLRAVLSKKPVQCGGQACCRRAHKARWGRDKAASEHQEATSPHFVSPQLSPNCPGFPHIC